MTTRAFILEGYDTMATRAFTEAVEEARGTGTFDADMADALARRELVLLDAPPMLCAPEKLAEIILSHANRMVGDSLPERLPTPPGLELYVRRAARRLDRWGPLFAIEGGGDNGSRYVFFGLIP